MVTPADRADARHGPATLLSRMLESLIAQSARIGRGAAWVCAGASFSGAVLIDYFSGSALNPQLLYLLATLVAAWLIGTRGGLAIAALATLAQIAVNGLYVGVVVNASHTHIHWGVFGWNVFGRIAVLCLFSVTAGALRATLEVERRRAERDGLTGVLNKSSFFSRMPIALRGMARSRETFVLAYMDLDGFKGVNDQHGHFAGDSVLVSFARGASEILGEGHLFARLGGDEFVALISAPSIDQAGCLAVGLHQQLSSVLAQTGFPVTCSMGAVIARPDRSLDQRELVRCADELMYEVKRSGKNALRVIRYGEPGQAQGRLEDRLEDRPGRYSATTTGRTRPPQAVRAAAHR